MYALIGSTALQILLNLMLAFYPRTKEMAVTVVDGGEEDGAVDELIAAEEATNTAAGGGGRGGGGGGANTDLHGSAKSHELNYDHYEQVDTVPMPSAPSSAAGAESGGVSRGGNGKGALGTGRHKPTAASTYEMNMEIAMMESKQQERSTNN